MCESTCHVPLESLLLRCSINLTIIHLAYGTIVTFGALLKTLKNTFYSVHNFVCVCVCIYIYIYMYMYAPHNDVSVNDGPHMRRWSHKIII